MSTRKIPFTEGAYYHLYNRGNSKQLIFRDKYDYQRFIYLLYISNAKNNFTDRDIDHTVYLFPRGEQLVSIGAWVLMPNHFHLLVIQQIDGGLSKFMQKLTTAYSMYFNNKYDRSGSLFEGKFKSKHADTDTYLKYLFSYQHLNPAKLLDKDWRKNIHMNKGKMLDFLKTYHYSSYQDYIGITRSENAILTSRNFPNYFPDKKSFDDEILDWLLFDVNIAQALPRNKFSPLLDE